MGSLMYRERRAKRPFPWKVALEVGPDIRINAVGYILIRREPPKTWKRCLARDSIDISLCRISKSGVAFLNLLCCISTAHL